MQVRYEDTNCQLSRWLRLKPTNLACLANDDGAGRQGWQKLFIRSISLTRQIALGLVGSGNNGGDTLVALIKLRELGWQTKAYREIKKA